MKVALVAPPYPLSEAPSPPLGLCYVAASFECGGAKVRIFDYIVRGYTPEKFKREMDRFQPDVVGANAVTMNFKAAADILITAKRHNPAVLTVMGGPHVSFDYANTLKTYPEIDLIVLGEGEDTLGELMPVIHDRSAWPGIRGLAFMSRGKPVDTGKRAFIRDLDTLPLPARHLLPVSRYQAMGFPVSIITSRGCPNRCIFCQGRRMVGMKVRYRSHHRVVDEIEDILSYGFTRINIADDFFTSNKRRVRLICDEILRRKLHFSWAAFARVDSVSREVIDLMRVAGCDTVSFGIESGNAEMLKRIQKGITLDQARQAVAMCREAGMGVFLSFMVGLPGETPRTLLDTRAFAEELDVPFGYHFLAPLPGTTLWEDIDRYDVELLTSDWDRFDANQAITRTSALSETEISAFVDVFNTEVDKYWQEVNERCEKGQGTAQDHSRLAAERRMHMIFNLLSKDLIEHFGSCMPIPSENGFIPQLADRLARVLDNPWDEIERIMSDLSEKGWIKYDRNGDRIVWYWTHNQKVDRMDFAG